MTIPIPSAKLAILFRAGQLPAINPANPHFTLDLGGVKIHGNINAKAVRKLAIWQGGAVLQGKLTVEHDKLVLAEAGFQFLEPRPVESSEDTPVGGATP